MITDPVHENSAPAHNHDMDTDAENRTQDDASLNTTQWRLVDSAVRHGYVWWLQEGSRSHVVLAHETEHPYSHRTLFVYRSGTTGQGATVFLATSDGVRRISQREAFSLLTNKSL